MQDALIRKLESFEELNDADRAALRTFVPRVRQVSARTDLIQEGDVPSDVHLILDGYACRYKVLPDGQRQIMSVFLPGDFCDLNVFILDQMDHSIGTISPCTVAEIPRQAIEDVITHHPRVTKALMWCSLVDEAVLREWLVNNGTRQADRRIAHLFCELLLRLEAVGRVSDNSYAFPFTQHDIADTMSLTSVHVNRTLQLLRGLNLISLKHRVLKILDVEQLKAYCEFNPNYLHLRNARWSGRRQVPWVSGVQGG